MCTRKSSPILPALMLGMALLLTGCTAQQWNQWDTLRPDSEQIHTMTPDVSTPAYSQYTHQQQNTWAAPAPINEDSPTRFSAPNHAEAIQQQLAHLKALETQTNPNRETGIPAGVHVSATNQPTSFAVDEEEIHVSRRATTPAMREETIRSIRTPVPSSPSISSETEAMAKKEVGDTSENIVSPRPDALHEQIRKIKNLTKADQNTLRSACSMKCTERLLDVSGAGTVSIRTTQAAVRAVIEVRSDTGDTSAHQLTQAEAAQAIATNQQIISEKTKNVIDYLKSTALAPFITKLATANIQLQPIYSYKDGAQLLKGYRSLVTITFQVDLEHAPEVLGGIIERGVTSIDSVSFVPSDEDLRAARMEAIKEAGADALAQTTAAITGVGEANPLTPLQIVSLNVMGVTLPSPVSMTNEVNIESISGYLPLQKAVFAPIAVVGGDKIVRATVSAKIRF